MIGVTENFRKIQDLLANAAIDAGRRPEDVQLLAVTKRQPAEALLEAAATGHRDFGENTVQEALPKIRELGRDELTWHFIGRLQANKTRQVAETFAWVHTLDRLRIAERLSRQRPANAQDLNICIQVNVDNEAQKSGVPADRLLPLARAITDLPRIRLRGLMCLPAIRRGFEEQRKPFALLRELNDELKTAGLPVDTLSMGMTADFRAAIFEGATIVRIGTALFGERQ